MLRQHNGITEYKNNNIKIKFTPDQITDAQRDPALTVSDILFWLDCYFVGETYCLSNYETGHTIYNTYSDRVYIFPWSCLDDLLNGRAVRLYARVPDETDRELLESEGY